ncbi:MAG TPA: hypothetical protein VHQ03_03785 [Candidatus Dormibacteraeota bacterium]|jgi:hypothetical protein|nr:hypothetical protein [Candidatus Dormibacteraeota bacterium]
MKQSALSRLRRLTAICGASTFLVVGGVIGSGATPVLASVPNETLFFLCEYSGNDGSHPDHVYVEGYNQYHNYVGHSFLDYATYTMNGSQVVYWWWQSGYWVYFMTWKGNYTYGWEAFYVSGRATYDTVLTATC